MCGRFTLTRRDLKALADELGCQIEIRPAEIPYRPRFNIAPSDRHFIVEPGAPAGTAPAASAGAGETRRLVAARWGFGRPGSGRPPLVNARAETVATRSAFRESFLHRRCVVPADGFFEWTGPASARRPIWYHRPGGELLLFAALYEDQGDEHAFTIITTAANDLVSPAHDRMPAILAPGEVDRWLARPDAALLAPAPEDALVAERVSTRVNSVANDDPACLEPAAAEPEPAPRPPRAQQLKLL